MQKANPEFDIKKSGDVRVAKDKYGLPKSKSEPVDLRKDSGPAGPEKYKPKKRKKAKDFKHPVNQAGKPVSKTAKVYGDAEKAHKAKAAKRVMKDKARKTKHANKVKIHQDKIRKMPKNTVKLDRIAPKNPFHKKAGELAKKQTGVRKRLRSKFWKGALKVL